jgi:chitinase domain-containing protein 1
MTDDVVEAACDAAGECAAAVPTSVLERGLVTTKPSVVSVLREHEGQPVDAKTKRFTGEALGYVTPWNGRGYDFARSYRAKLDYVSPVWLQVREDAQRQPIITGTHDIDADWVRDVKYGPGSRSGDAAKAGPKMVPRVMYERNKLSDEDVPQIVDALLVLARVHDFDGFVFEVGSLLASP